MPSWSGSAGLGADVAIIDTPPRAWVSADNAALAAAKLADLVFATVPALDSWT